MSCWSLGLKKKNPQNQSNNPENSFKLTAYWETDLICSSPPDWVSSTLIAAPTLLVGDILPRLVLLCWSLPGPGCAQTGGVSPALCTEGHRTGRKIIKPSIKPVPGLQWTVLEMQVFSDRGALELFCHSQRKVQLLCTQASACWHFRAGQGHRGFVQPPSPCWPKDKTAPLSLGELGQKQSRRFNSSQRQNWYRKGNERPSMSKAQGWPFSHKVPEGVNCHNPLKDFFKPHLQIS